MNHYEVLGVAPDADERTLRAAYRRLAKQHHPDRPGGDHNKMQALTLAYGILSDPEKRARYDRTGQSERPPELYAQAANMIADAFSQYLEKGGDEDPLETMRNSIDHSRAKTHESIESLRESVTKLQRKAKRVRRKKHGHDLFAAVIDKKVKELTARIEGGEHFLKLTDTAMALLDEYEFVPPKPESSSGFIYTDGNVFKWS